MEETENTLPQPLTVKTVLTTRASAALQKTIEDELQIPDDEGITMAKLLNDQARSCNATAR